MDYILTGNGCILCGDGISHEDLMSVARCFSTAAPAPAKASRDAVMLVADVDEERLARAFEHSKRGCFEVFEKNHLPKNISTNDITESGLVFSFSSRTVYRLPVARHITKTLVAALELCEERKGTIELALHEALANAVIHGNLELGHIKKDTIESIDFLDTEIENRLSIDTFALRRVDILINWTPTSVQLSVYDGGSGFSLNQDKWDDMPWRGISLISSLASSIHVGESGQPLTMIFDRSGLDVADNTVLEPTNVKDSVDDGSKPIFIKNCRILVVEDSLPIRRVIGAFLKSAGYENVEFGVDGLEGLSKVATFDPDLVILDIRMPNLDGFGFLRQLRANHKYADLPVLVQTAYTEPEERNKAFIEGGTDLTTKPINGVELLARVKIHLENRMLLRSLQDYRFRLENELAAARKMQEALLPQPERVNEIKDKLGLEVESYFEPSSELGGDFWGIFCLDDHRVAVAITDFSGHGVNSAVNTFRLHTLMDGANMPSSDPAAYLTVLNEKLTKLIPRGQFATMFYGIIDIQTDQLTYSAAASPSPIVGCENHFEFYEASGIPLGISEEAVYENRIVDFPDGSFLFLYSDALTETEGENDVMLDEHGLGKLMDSALNTASIQHPFANVLQQFGKRVSRPLPDDLTAVWLARK